MKAEEYFNNEFGEDCITVHRKCVIALMTNFAEHKLNEQSLLNSSCEKLNEKYIPTFDEWLHKSEILTTKHNTFINGYQLKTGESITMIYEREKSNI